MSMLALPRAELERPGFRTNQCSIIDAMGESTYPRFYTKMPNGETIQNGESATFAIIHNRVNKQYQTNGTASSGHNRAIWEHRRNLFRSLPSNEVPFGIPTKNPPQVISINQNSLVNCDGSESWWNICACCSYHGCKQDRRAILCKISNSCRPFSRWYRISSSGQCDIRRWPT